MFVLFPDVPGESEPAVLLLVFRESEGLPSAFEVHFAEARAQKFAGTYHSFRQVSSSGFRVHQGKEWKRCRRLDEVSTTAR